MATEGNLRYLQYILLLGEGSSLVLQGITNRETRKRQTTLETILDDNKHSLRNHITDVLQFERVFPVNGPINTDVNTWDIALLSKVSLYLFGSTLTWGEKASIRFLKDMRNELHAHASSMSLEHEEFESVWSELSTTLTTLATCLTQEIQDKCTELITELGQGLQDLESAKKKIKTFAQYDEHFMKALELIVGALDSGLCLVADKIQEGFIVIQEELTRNKDEIEGKIQSTSEEIHEYIDQKACEVKETIETKAEEFKDVLNDAKQSTSDIKEEISDVGRCLENVTNEVSNMQENVGAFGDKLDDCKQILTKDMGEVKYVVGDTQNTVQGVKTKMDELCDIMKMLLREGREFRAPQVVDAEVDVEGPSEEITSEAEEQLLKEFERARASALAIAKRAKQSNDPNAIDELGTVVRQFMERIESIEDVQTDNVHKQCILLHIRCSSGVGMLELLRLLKSDGIQDNLDDIAKVLTNHYGGKFRLTARVVPESVQKAVDHLSTDTDVPAKKTVHIPIRCNTLAGLAQICNFFSTEETVSCFEDMSAALTRKLGRKITVGASLNIDKVNEALANVGEETVTNVDAIEPVLRDKQISSRKHISSEIHISDDELEAPRPKVEYGGEVSQAAEGYTSRCKPYILKSQKQVIVRLKDDKNVCNIYGCCSLPDGSFLLADHSNKKVKRMDKGYELVDYCVLPAKPWDVCYAGDGEAIVSMNNNSVQFVNVDGQLSLTRTIKFGHPCWGVTKSTDRLYIKGGASMFSYTRSGEDKHIFYTDPSGEHSYQHIEADVDGSKFYLTGGTETFTVTVLDHDGKLFGTFTDSEHKSSRDICLDGDGNIYICSDRCKSVVQVESDSLEKVANVITSSDEVNCPWCICFDRDKTAMIIGHLRSDMVTVVDLRT